MWIVRRSGWLQPCRRPHSIRSDCCINGHFLGYCKYFIILILLTVAITFFFVKILFFLCKWAAVVSTIHIFDIICHFFRMSKFNLDCICHSDSDERDWLEFNCCSCVARCLCTRAQSHFILAGYFFFIFRTLKIFYSAAAWHDC